jgi:hypothetical protein
METTYTTQRSRRNSLTPGPARDRAWWRAEARRTKTDWSSILRQRIRVLAWVRAGRPPLSNWHADMMSGDRP